MAASSNEKKLGDAIKDLLKAYRLSDGLNEARLISAWESVVGNMVSKHTRKLFISKKILFVVVDSPALKNELSYSKKYILDKLHAEIGEEVVIDIVFK